MCIDSELSPCRACASEVFGRWVIANLTTGPLLARAPAELSPNCSSEPNPRSQVACPMKPEQGLP
eukprot:7738150-Pyramimonas_sp.AAC.1